MRLVTCTTIDDNGRATTTRPGPTSRPTSGLSAPSDTVDDSQAPL